MKSKSGIWIALLGVMFIVALQSLWLSGTYRLLEENLRKEISDIVEEAMLRERDLRMDRFYADTVNAYLSFDERADELTRFNEALTDEGLPVSLLEVDSIARSLLVGQGIRNQITIDLVDAATGRVLATSSPRFRPHFSFIASQAVAVNYERTRGIRLLVDNPYRIIFGRMIVLILASCVLFGLVIWSILMQVRFIRQKDKIATLRQDFTYAMVHDMKTPLSSIIMSLRNLRSGRLDGKEALRARYMSIAEEEASQLLELTNKILTLSRLENHRLELHIDRVELEPLVTSLVQKFGVKTAGKEVIFETHLKVPQVMADPQYLSEALSNLIDNSIKYSGEVVHIDIASQETFGHVIISVRDDGMGIAPDDLQVIFDKFERGEATRRSRQGGASGFGLGLNLVSQVLNAHGGKVEVESVEGAYSKFSLWFPKEVKIEEP